MPVSPNYGPDPRLPALGGDFAAGSRAAAASQPAQRRVALPAWFDGTPLPPIEAVTATLADMDSSVCASVLRRRQANYLPTGKLM